MNKKILGLVVLIAVIIGYILVFGLDFEGTESDHFVPAVTGENVSAYKNSCTELNLSQISKDPQSFNGKNVKVTGQLYKKYEYVQFDKKRTNMVLKVPGFSPDPYILVTYTGTLSFILGDNVTVYGEYSYPFTDTTVPEIADKSLPDIRAGYVEKA